MVSVPYSRYLIKPVTWYSFLIMVGAVLAIILACREERRNGLPKDTVIDLVLRILPFGIIGARIYYVVFSWDQFRSDFFSVFRIWEGGLAIYGGIFSGLIVLLCFCRKRSLPPLVLCDVVVPGLALAQSLGRWGNWFNIEAYGISVSRPELCFFPLALQVPSDGYSWHLATFFYESLWDFIVFIFLLIARYRFLKKRGDIFFFYVFLYAAGRLVIEDLRLDSLYAVSSIRISQLFSIMLCLVILFRYVLSVRRKHLDFPSVRLVIIPVSLSASAAVLTYTISGPSLFGLSSFCKLIFLLCYAVLMISFLFWIYHIFSVPEVNNADNMD